MSLLQDHEHRQDGEQLRMGVDARFALRGRKGGVDRQAGEEQGDFDDERRERVVEEAGAECDRVVGGYFDVCGKEKKKKKKKKSENEERMGRGGGVIYHGGGRAIRGGSGLRLLRR
jgi:hypothetical protein